MQHFIPLQILLCVRVYLLPHLSEFCGNYIKAKVKGQPTTTIIAFRQLLLLRVLGLPFHTCTHTHIHMDTLCICVVGVGHLALFALRVEQLQAGRAQPSLCLVLFVSLTIRNMRASHFACVCVCVIWQFSSPKCTSCAVFTLRFNRQPQAVKCVRVAPPPALFSYSFHSTPNGFWLRNLSPYPN